MSGAKAAQKLQQHDIATILRHYRFDEKDAAHLKELRPLFDEYLDRIIPGFYEFIFSFAHAKAFLRNAEILQRHRRGIRRWFIALVAGEYDERYFHWLAGVSEIHVRIGLPSHYVNAAFSYVREVLGDLLLGQGYTQELNALNKILDINLDILSLTYKDEEKQQLISEVVLLKRAIRYGSVEVYAQPIVSAALGETVGYECLMRISDPQSGEIYSIYPLLKTAKSIHLYEGLMELMIEKALGIFSTLPYGFSLNLSYEDIADRRFRRYLNHKIREFPHPERIVFEILETDFIEDFDIVDTFLQEVRRLGCSIAVDDFGSGYSSMENILKFKPEYIKIEGSLLEGIVQSPETQLLVGNIIQMARDLGARTVAEHVSSKEVYEAVQKMGVDYLQGFYFAKPFPAKKLLGENEEGSGPEGPSKGGNESIQKEEK